MPKNSVHPASKKDLEKTERSINRQIKDIQLQNSKLWLETTSIRQELKETTSLLKNSILKFKVEILGEVRAMRQELKATLKQYKRHEETLDNHETRIKTLKTAKFA